MKINKLFSRKKKAKTGEFLNFDEELPYEPATTKQLMSIISLSRRLNKKMPKDMNKLSKSDATQILSALIKEAESKGIRKREPNQEEDYLYDDNEFSMGWGFEDDSQGFF